MKTLEEHVENILFAYPETRDSDELLYAKFLSVDNSFDFSNISAIEFFKTRKYTGVPPFSSVGRARRKIQEQHPELRGSKQVQKARKDLEEKYREYYRK